MMYYEYFLNIDVSVYENQPKEKGLMEVMAVRLDCIKKILAVFFYERERFQMIEPDLESILDK